MLLSPASVRAVRAEVVEVDCERRVAQVQGEAREFRAPLNLRLRLTVPIVPSVPKPVSAWLLEPLIPLVRPNGLGLGPQGLNSNLLPANASQLVASALTSSEPAWWRTAGSTMWRRGNCGQKAAGMHKFQATDFHK